MLKGNIKHDGMTFIQCCEIHCSFSLAQSLETKLCQVLARGLNE